MSETTAPPEDVHGLIGAYALDALDDLERASFERHLAGCPDCQAELPGLRAAAARVGAAAAVTAPLRLRRAILAEVARTRQQPPLVPQPDVPRRPARLARVLAAVAAAVVLVTTGTAVGLGVALHRERSRADQLAALLAHPERVATAPVAGGGTAVVAFAHGRAAVRLAGVAAPPASRAYELWVVPPSGDPRPAGLVTSAGGSALVEGVSGAKALAVTVEPASGSPRPTSTPLVVVPA